MNLTLVLKVNLALGTFYNMGISTELVASIICFHTAVFNKVHSKAIQKRNTVWQSENSMKAEKKLQISVCPHFKAQLTKQQCL